jgi:hypothetical protein
VRQAQQWACSVFVVPKNEQAYNDCELFNSIQQQLYPKQIHTSVGKSVKGLKAEKEVLR